MLLMKPGHTSAKTPLHRIALGLGGLGLLLVYPFAWIIHPFVTSGLGPPLCAYLAITGKPCPFCGMTRAFASVMHGNLDAAFSYNVLWLLPFIALAGFALLCLCDAIFDTDLIRRFGERGSWPAVAFLATFIIYGIIRAMS